MSAPLNSPGWPRLITELEEHLTLTEIGHEIGVGKSTVWRYREGLGEPRDSVAAKLRALRERFPATETRLVVKAPS